MTKSVLPADLRFPTPAFPIMAYASIEQYEADCAAYFKQITDWRERVLRALHDLARPAEQYDLSPRAELTLLHLLRSRRPGGNTTDAESPYDVRAFPATGESSSSAIVLEIVLWRACLLDYLDDIWDVMGTPRLDMDECSVLTAFLTPADYDGSTCRECFEQFEGRSPRDHRCEVLAYVRAKWPPFPARD